MNSSVEYALQSLKFSTNRLLGKDLISFVNLMM